MHFFSKPIHGLFSDPLMWHRLSNVTTTRNIYHFRPIQLVVSRSPNVVFTRGTISSPLSRGLFTHFYLEREVTTDWRSDRKVFTVRLQQFNRTPTCVKLARDYRNQRVSRFNLFPTRRTLTSGNISFVARDHHHLVNDQHSVLRNLIRNHPTLDPTSDHFFSNRPKQRNNGNVILAKHHQSSNHDQSERINFVL